MDKYEKEIKHFGMLHDYVDSKDYLLKHPYLTCDDTANYLALWCINLQVQEVSISSIGGTTSTFSVIKIILLNTGTC